jgi:hypothetical protein
MFILSLPEILFLIAFHFLLAIAALAYEIAKQKGKFTASNVVWGVVLFGVPLLGIALYCAVQLAQVLLYTEEKAQGITD